MWFIRLPPKWSAWCRNAGATSSMKAPRIATCAARFGRFIRCRASLASFVHGRPAFVGSNRRPAPGSSRWKRSTAGSASVRQRTDADPAVDLFHLEDPGAGRRLLPTKAGRPCTKLAKLALQRMNLPNLAAQVAILGAFIEEVAPAFRHHALHFGGSRMNHIYRDAIAVARDVDHAESFLRQPSGI